MEPILFQIIEWEQNHEKPDKNLSDDDSGNDSDIPEEKKKSKLEDLEYKIKLYGRTKDNKSIYVRVDGYTPFFYVEIPKFWDQVKVMTLVNFIKGKISSESYISKKTGAKINKEYLAKGLIKFDVIERKKFYGFTGHQNFKFIRLIFKNMMSYKEYERWIENNKIMSTTLFKFPTKLQLYESNIEPFIRCMHIRKLNACGWVSVNKYNKLDSISFCDYDISVNWTDLMPHDDNSIQKFVVASFDLECMSESGNFPQATNENDPIIQIGTVFSYYGESEPFYKHMITLGGCEKIDALKDVDVESYKTERSVLLAWTRLIQKMNPDVITGYNINGFDFEYLYLRAKKIEEMTKKPLVESFLKLSKIIGEDSPYKTKELSSSGLGDNFLKYISMGGRIVIDLMKVAQRDFKLDSYKLDNVTASFIKEPIKGRTIDKENNTITINTTSTYGIKEDQYVNIMFNDGLTDNKHDEKYKILKIDEKEKKITLNGVIPDELFEAPNKVFWCHAKDDITAKDMFRMYKGTDKDRAIIAKYCIQDCVLVTKLMEKLQVLNNNIGMANVCGVPLSYIFMRGQGPKIFSLVSKKCRDMETLIPKIKMNGQNIKIDGPESNYHKVKNNKEDEDSSDDEKAVGYEGATVFPPVKGVHYEPIPVLDYASLYPRSMIYRNISHECIVIDPKYDNLPDYNYQTVTYKNNDKSTTTCRYAKHKDGSKGILCLILIELLDKRSATKKLMEQTDNKFLKNIYDGLQLAYKVTANSLYGQVGAPTSAIYLMQLAASTTATGREMLEFSRDFIEGPFGDLVNFAIHDKEKYQTESVKLYTGENETLKSVYPSVYLPTPDKKFNEPRAKRENMQDFIDYFYDKVNSVLNKNYGVKPKIIYGDSVTGDMPILLLNSENQVEIKEIKDIGRSWVDYSQFKSDISGLTDKEHDSLVNYKVWTDKGWSNIKRVIRHKTNKRIYEISTPNGYVKVTEDHSLLDKSGNQIKPLDCKIGLELLHNDEFKSRCKCNLSLQNCNCEIGDRLDKIYKELNGTIKNAFEYNIYSIETDDKIKAMEVYYLAKELQLYVQIITLNERFIIKYAEWREELDIHYAIEKINDLGYINDYVYDLETDVGHFQAGVGSMIVKNTDSVFFTMKIHDKKTLDIKTDKEALAMCIEFGQLAGATICKILPDPEEQVYEKTLWPLVLISKKRYVGNLYETDVNKYYQKSMGIVLKRRDNAKIVKIVVGGIVNYILNERSNQGAIDYTRALIKKILRGHFGIDKFIISKTLRGEYKGLKMTTDEHKDKNTGKKDMIPAGTKGTWDWDDVICSLAHVTLCQRIKRRDPGNSPESNDRVPYVYVIPKKKVTLQGDRVEDPKYVLENKLDLDYLFYITNQIMKPSIQFLELIAHNPEKLFQNYINKEINRRKNISSIYDYVIENNDDNNDNQIIVPPSKNIKKKPIIEDNLDGDYHDGICVEPKLAELEELDELDELDKKFDKLAHNKHEKTADELDAELESKFVFTALPNKEKKTKVVKTKKSTKVEKPAIKKTTKPSLTIDL
jgi:DNA polymerase elongation subunit (family B)